MSIADEASQPKPRGAACAWPGTAFGEIGLHLVVAMCALAGVLLFYAKYYPLHHDLAGSLLSGRLALMLGDAFGNYSAYFPPAEKAWFSFAVRLSDLTGIRQDFTIIAMSTAMVLFGAGLAYRIRRMTVGATPLFLIVPVLILMIAPILYKNMFGLREHLVVAGLWPYLVLRVSDPDGTKVGRTMRLVVGLWVGATLLFKYLYALVVLLVELADALVQRRALPLFRIENLAAGAMVFLYLFLWLGIDPGQRAAINSMVSSIDGNLVGPRDNFAMIVESLRFGVLLLIASLVFKVPTRLVAIAFATLLGSVFAAWWQLRWYTHHLFPITMAYVVWWWIAAPQFRWWAQGAVAVFVIGSIAGPLQDTAKYRTKLAELDRAMDHGGQSVAGKRVALLNAHPSPYNQFLASHGAVRWTPLMNNAYVSAQLKPLDIPANAGRLAPPVSLSTPGRRLLHDEMLRLWEDMPPDAILIDRTDSWPLRYLKLDWLHVFSKDRRFQAILAHYRPVQVYDGKEIRFTYYVRAD